MRLTGNGSAWDSVLAHTASAAILALPHFAYEIARIIAPRRAMFAINRHRTRCIVISVYIFMICCLLPAPARASGTITLLGQLDLSTGARQNSDVWGWVDPMTDKEYALVGEYLGNRVYMVDVSDPTNPVLAKTISVLSNNGQDLKVWGNHLYVVDGNGMGFDGQIFDLTNPSPIVVGAFISAHNITFDDNGYMYNSIVGLSILNTNVNPTNPSIIWSTAGAGHDATIVGNRLFDFHGWDGTWIWDITNPASPIELGKIVPPRFAIQYHHSGAVTSDGQILFINDELADQHTAGNADIRSIDVSDPTNWVHLATWRDNNARVHNSYLLGNYLHVSYYTAGYRVFDVSDPTSIVLCDTYDTSAFSGNGFQGAWGIYTGAPSGNIYISDTDNGLYVFRFDPTASGITDRAPQEFALEQNFPNPFNPATTISYALESPEFVSLSVFDANGRRVRALVAREQSPGPHSAVWDATDDAGHRVASGVYFYRLTVGGVTDSRRMVLLK